MIHCSLQKYNHMALLFSLWSCVRLLKTAYLPFRLGGYDALLFGVSEGWNANTKHWVHFNKPPVKCEN